MRDWEPGRNVVGKFGEGTEQSSVMSVGRVVHICAHAEGNEGTKHLCMAF